jgi:hypothetical protein
LSLSLRRLRLLQLHLSSSVRVSHLRNPRLLLLLPNQALPRLEKIPNPIVVAVSFLPPPLRRLHFSLQQLAHALQQLLAAQMLG